MLRAMRLVVHLIGKRAVGSTFAPLSCATRSAHRYVRRACGKRRPPTWPRGCHMTFDVYVRAPARCCPRHDVPPLGVSADMAFASQFAPRADRVPVDGARQRCAPSPFNMLHDLSARDGTAGVIGLAVGFVLGFATKHILGRRLEKLPDYDSDDDADFVPSSYARADEEHKLVLCVRTDLKMQKGKIAAQVGHATLGAYKAAARRTPTALAVWERNAQPKIAVQIRSQREADALRSRASRLGLPTYIVYDAGRTQIAAGSMTVLAVGPGPVSLVNQVTGKLKLL